MARICYASDEESAREQFGKAFDSFCAQGCLVQAVVRNDVTGLLWSNEALALFEQVDPRGCLEANSKFHFNLS